MTIEVRFLPGWWQVNETPNAYSIAEPKDLPVEDARYCYPLFVWLLNTCTDDQLAAHQYRRTDSLNIAQVLKRGEYVYVHTIARANSEVDRQNPRSFELLKFDYSVYVKWRAAWVLINPCSLDWELCGRLQIVSNGGALTVQDQASFPRAELFGNNKYIKIAVKSMRMRHLLDRPFNAGIATDGSSKAVVVDNQYAKLLTAIADAEQVLTKKTNEVNDQLNHEPDEIGRFFGVWQVFNAGIKSVLNQYIRLLFNIFQKQQYLLPPKLDRENPAAVLTDEARLLFLNPEQCCYRIWKCYLAQAHDLDISSIDRQLFGLLRGRRFNKKELPVVTEQIFAVLPENVPRMQQQEGLWIPHICTTDKRYYAIFSALVSFSAYAQGKAVFQAAKSYSDNPSLCTATARLLQVGCFFTIIDDLFFERINYQRFLKALDDLYALIKGDIENPKRRFVHHSTFFANVVDPLYRRLHELDKNDPQKVDELPHRLRSQKFAEYCQLVKTETNQLAKIVNAFGDFTSNKLKPMTENIIQLNEPKDIYNRALAIRRTLSGAKLDLGELNALWHKFRCATVGNVTSRVQQQYYIVFGGGESLLLLADRLQQLLTDFSYQFNMLDSGRATNVCEVPVMILLSRDKRVEFYNKIADYLPLFGQLRPGFDFMGRLADYLQSKKNVSYQEVIALIIRQYYDYLQGWSSLSGIMRELNKLIRDKGNKNVQVKTLLRDELSRLQENNLKILQLVLSEKIPFVADFARRKCALDIGGVDDLDLYYGKQSAYYTLINQFLEKPNSSEPYYQLLFDIVCPECVHSGVMANTRVRDLDKYFQTIWFGMAPPHFKFALGMNSSNINDICQKAVKGFQGISYKNLAKINLNVLSALIVAIETINKPESVKFIASIVYRLNCHLHDNILTPYKNRGEEWSITECYEVMKAFLACPVVRKYLLPDNDRQLALSWRTIESIVQNYVAELIADPLACPEAIIRLVCTDDFITDKATVKSMLSDVSRIELITALGEVINSIDRFNATLLGTYLAVSVDNCQRLYNFIATRTTYIKWKGKRGVDAFRLMAETLLPNFARSFLLDLFKNGNYQFVKECLQREYVFMFGELRILCQGDIISTLRGKLNLKQTANDIEVLVALNKLEHQSGDSMSPLPSLDVSPHEQLPTLPSAVTTPRGDAPVMLSEPGTPNSSLVTVTEHSGENHTDEDDFEEIKVIHLDGRRRRNSSIGGRARARCNAASERSPRKQRQYPVDASSGGIHADVLDQALRRVDLMRTKSLPPESFPLRSSATTTTTTSSLLSKLITSQQRASVPAQLSGSFPIQRAATVETISPIRVGAVSYAPDWAEDLNQEFEPGVYRQECEDDEEPNYPGLEQSCFNR